MTASKPIVLVTLFETLLRETPTHAWFENLLANADHYPTPLLNRFFEAILGTGQIDADRLIRSRGDELLRLFAGQSGLERIGSQFMLTSPADVLNNPNISRFLDTLGNEPSFNDELKKRITAIQTVRAYSTNPTFTVESNGAGRRSVRHDSASLAKQHEARTLWYCRG